MKLWVDDIRDVPDSSWTLARTITTAINLISMYGESLTHISLDHDISFQVEVMGESRPFPSPDTFQAVAHYIRAYYTGSPHNIGVWAGDRYPVLTTHSANPVGRRAIMDIFRGYLHCDEVPLPACNRYDK